MNSPVPTASTGSANSGFAALVDCVYGNESLAGSLDETLDNETDADSIDEGEGSQIDLKLVNQPSTFEQLVAEVLEESCSDEEGYFGEDDNTMFSQLLAELLFVGKKQEMKKAEYGANNSRMARDLSEAELDTDDELALECMSDLERLRGWPVEPTPMLSKIEDQSMDNPMEVEFQAMAALYTEFAERNSIATLVRVIDELSAQFKDNCSISDVEDEEMPELQQTLDVEMSVYSLCETMTFDDLDDTFGTFAEPLFCSTPISCQQLLRGCKRRFVFDSPTATHARKLVRRA